MNKPLYTLLLVAIMLLLSMRSFASGKSLVKYEVILLDILSLNKYLSRDTACIIAEHILNYSEYYEINPKIAIVIFKIESNFDINAVNYKSRDFGLGQINAKNMKHYRFNLGLQMTSYKYAINSTFIILADLKKRHRKKDKEWWLRYHSNTREYRKIYKKRFDKAMEIIK